MSKLKSQLLHNVDDKWFCSLFLIFLLFQIKLSETHFFFQIYKKNSKKFSAGSEFKKLIKKRDRLESLGGTSKISTEGTKHSFIEAEKVAFVDWINTALQDDEEVKAYLPLNPETSDVFGKIKNGIILW